jgi:H+/Cl- antiporter ClcA
LGLNLVRQEGIYAIVGAAATAGAATKTIAAGIIALELTG